LKLAEDGRDEANARADKAAGLKADLKAARAEIAARDRQIDALQSRLERAQRAEAALAAIREALN
jgi:hypothetical protein